MRCSECPNEVSQKRLRQHALTCSVMCSRTRDKRLVKSKSGPRIVRDKMFPLAEGLAEEIRELMDKKKLNCQRLAEKIGVTKQTIELMFRKGQCSSINIRKIGTELGLSHGYVTRGMDTTGIIFECRVEKTLTGVAAVLDENPKATYHEMIQRFPDELPSNLKKRMRRAGAKV